MSNEADFHDLHILSSDIPFANFEAAKHVSREGEEKLFSHILNTGCTKHMSESPDDSRVFESAPSSTCPGQRFCTATKGEFSANLGADAKV
jgi:hypothetical protein